MSRWYQTSNENVKIDLHVFGDASEDAFCAEAYIVIETRKAEREDLFIIGKARVAPVKHNTILTLELMAAVTGNRLKDAIMKEHSLHFHKTFIWSDSTTVIQWISSSNVKQSTFVANRVAEILDTSTVEEWHYIAGVKNLANLGTRGISFDDASRSNWIQGPEWLKQPIVLEEDNHHPAEQDMDVHVIIAKDDSQNILKWENFSQFNRLLRTVSCILSWKHKSKKAYELLNESRDVIWKIVHMKSSAIERKLLLSGKTISPNSKVVSLVPLIDSNGILRAKRRLRKADLPYETKHPVILPNKHRAVQLYLSYQHKVFHHEGVEYIRNEVQRKFRIIG